MDPRRRGVPARQRVRGKVVSLTDYGAFVELEQGIEGLIHVSEMTWTKKVKHPSKIVEVGERSRRGARGRPAAKRISLGLKQLEPNPFASFTDKYPPGTVVKGKVRNITDYGVFVGIEEGVDGMVHASDLSLDPAGQPPGRPLPQGRRGRGDHPQHRHRRREEGLPRHQAAVRRSVGSHPRRVPGRARSSTAKVIKVLDFGAFVEIEQGVEGLVHVSELSDERVEDPKKFVKPGQTSRPRSSTSTRPSARSGCRSAARPAPRSWRTRRASRAACRRATLGDVMRDKLAALHGKTNKKTGQTRPNRSPKRRAKRTRGPRATSSASPTRVASRRGTLSGPASDPMATPASRPSAWLRQFAKLWGFALFCVFVVYLFREVALPFLFAILVAYILAPLVDRFGRLRVGDRPFPRAAAVIILYVNILAGLGLFIGYFVPKLSGDFARLFREAPQLFAKVNREWLPKAGAWVDQHFGAEVAADDNDEHRRQHRAQPPAPRGDRDRAARRRPLRARSGGVQLRGEARSRAEST